MTVKSQLSRVSSVYNLWSCKASTARSTESKNTVCMQFLQVFISEAQKTIKLSIVTDLYEIQSNTTTYI